MTKLITFDDGSRLVVETVNQRSEVAELETGETISVPSSRIETVADITGKTMEPDGLHGTLNLENGSVPLPLSDEGIADSLVAVEERNYPTAKHPAKDTPHESHNLRWEEDEETVEFWCESCDERIYIHKRDDPHPSMDEAKTP